MRGLLLPLLHIRGWPAETVVSALPPFRVPTGSIAMEQGLQAWTRWLTGEHTAAAPLPPLPDLYSIEKSFSRLMSAQPAWADEVFDWVFPADRYSCEATLDRLLSLSTPVTAGIVRQVLDTPKVNEHLLRSFYASYLHSLGASVDHHGWVYPDHGSAVLGDRLQSLDEAGRRRVARLLRFLHLAGWRGFSYDGAYDRYDFSYAHGLSQALERAWEAGQERKPYPRPWRDAMRDAIPRQSKSVLGLCLRRIKVLGETLYRR